MASLIDLHRLNPGTKVRLKSLDPSDASAFAKQSGAKYSAKGDKDAIKADAEQAVTDNALALADLQFRLYAENKHALLVVLQGMDTSGKDGVIRHVFSRINPQGCLVTSFKKPCEHEVDRDYLYRIHEAIPAKGEIGIFNRAHYEDVLIVRVHNLVPKDVWSKRYNQINEFEHYLTENGVVILKFFLHISKDEQRERLQARLDDPTKNWKYSPQDVAERKHWDDYQAAYEEALTRCSTKWAAWYSVPSDKKWYRNWAVSAIVRARLEAMNPTIPKPLTDLKKIKIV